ncbi:MAG: hypothetical protein HFJ65_07085 [Eggerthellaceae bacterium]|nr:hypothetical protein [Eggerthellaceae bacterium]
MRMTTIARKSAKAAISAALVAGLCIPLAACQTSPLAETGSDGDDIRWADFDDGSDMLSINAPYLTSTADQLTFNVTCEQGTFAEEVDASQISLDGAIRSWTVESAERTDDVTLELTIVRPEGTPNNGASFAYVNVPDALIRPHDSMELEKTETNIKIEEGLTSDQINEDKGVIWPDYALIVDEDVEVGEAYAEEADAMLVEGGAASGVAAEDAGASDQQAEQAPASHAAYEVAVMFATPTLELDAGSLELDGSELKATVLAGSFQLPDDLSADDFALEDGEGCAVKDVRLISPTEAEVTLSLPEDEGAGALDGSTLTLKADSNESEADVVCSLEVPEPWLALQQSHVNEEGGELVYEATLMNSADALSQDAVQVRVNGEEVSGWKLASEGGGSYSVTLSSDSAPHGSVVEVDVADVTDAAGRQVDVAEAAALADLSDDGRKFGDTLASVLDSIDFGDLAKAGAKKGLGALAEMGWKMFCENSLGMHEVTNNELMDAITQVQEQVADLSAQMGYVRNDVLTGQNRSTIDTANNLLARIKTRELQLSDKVRNIMQEPDDAEQQDLLTSYINGEKAIIDELATDLGQLYHVIMNADSSTNHNLIQVYDDLMAQSYNWGLQTFEQRQLFRANLANIWVNGAQMVMLAYGNSGDHDAYLDELDKQTKSLDALINQTMVLSADTCIDPVPASSKEDPAPTWDESDDWFYNGGLRDDFYSGDDGDLGLSDDEYEYLRMQAIIAGNDPSDYEDRIVQRSDSYSGYRADPTASSNTDASAPQKHYCNTTGKWYFGLNGGDTQYAWYKGLAWPTNSWNPDMIAASPFDMYKNGSSVITWGDHYMTTTEAKALADKLHDGQTMKEELESLGMVTAKYLVTSSRLDNKSKVVYVNNDWYMDTFEVALANKAGEGFTKEMQHFDGYKVTDIDSHLNWRTEPYDLFVLATDVPTF